MNWKFWKRESTIEPDDLCKTCGHERHHHNAIVNNKHGQYTIEGCGIIDVASKPYAPWTMESIAAGQHKPCRCKWDGKSKQSARK
jgi:hypothetical protein